MLETYEKEIFHALKMDLNKSKHEALITELGVIYSELNFALKHLQEWMKDTSVPAPLTHTGTKNTIMYEAYGVTLIIAPWNYPIQLALVPVIGAIAAGNTVILKPSELTKHTSSLLYKMVRNTFESSFFTVVEGDAAVSQALLKERFDYIFFTGSSRVGKLVMREASNHLTPVTLELGGKSPVIVDEDASVTLSAKRIVWGKLINAGQTCVAPDYLYVHKSLILPFKQALIKQIKSMYGKHPLKNKHYTRIVSEAHFNRLTKYIQAGNVAYGGQVDQRQLKIEPTLLTDVDWEDKVMQEEIFGPILPILVFHDIKEVISRVRQGEKPLALYYFGHNKQKQAAVLQQVSAGGACVNDTVFHLANAHLPFGGVGASGMGAYHGKHSFLTFSHQKSVLSQTTKFDIPVRYPTSKLPGFIKKKLLT